MRAFTGSVRFSQMPWLRACSPHSLPFSMCQIPGWVAIQSGPGSPPALAGEALAAADDAAAGAVAGAPGRSKPSSNGDVIAFAGAGAVVVAVAVGRGAAGAALPAS